jgi:uncharacterized hydrophobic protein (TIGR00271 family)
MPYEERRRVLEELSIRRPDHWAVRFSIMLTLSVVVAVMGLSADSPAVVIGAMLLAPLMQPVLATAACIAMALLANALRSFGVVALATLGAIALSFVLAAVFVNGELPHEVTSRTAPDIRDLVVALGAGAAGAYATVRRDVSSSLPGVAVAVALVPPLAVIGITVQAGNSTLAWGAMLLYLTNLVAIVFAGTFVFVVTGFVSPHRLAHKFRRTALSTSAVGAVLIAVALPLYGASISAAQRSDREVEALALVSAWLGATDRREAPLVTFDEQRITVEVRSFDGPPDPDPLITSMRAAFGEAVVVSIEWDRVDQATTTTTSPPVTSVVSDDDRLQTQVAAIIDRWLADLGPDKGARRDLLSITGNVVRLDASGTGDAPSLLSLTERLDSELATTFEVQLTWLKRETVEQPRPTTPDEILADQISAVANSWAARHDVTVTATSFDGDRAVVELIGPQAPDATDLIAEIDALIGLDDAVMILFVQRLDITTSSTTTTTTTTTTTSTASSAESSLPSTPG